MWASPRPASLGETSQRPSSLGGMSQRPASLGEGSLSKVSIATKMAVVVNFNFTKGIQIERFQ